MAMHEADLDEARWQAAGPLVGAAADLLRAALGTPVNSSAVSAPAVVREADFAMAARPLLHDASIVVDGEAAAQFLQLCRDAALALG